MGLFDFISAKAREEERKERMKNAGNIAMGTLLGLAAGAAASYLFAPRSGEETREMIAKKSKETYNDMREGIANATQRAKELGQSALEKAKEFKDEAAQRAEELKDEAVDKAKELKDKAEDKAKELKDKAEDKAIDAKKEVEKKANDVKKDVEKEVEKAKK